MSSNKCYTEIGQVSNNFKSLTNVTFDKNKRQGKVNLYTSYLGEVSTICSYINENECFLDCVKTIEGNSIRFLVLDSKEHNLDIQHHYSLQYLNTLSPLKVNVLHNRMAHYLLLLISRQMTVSGKASVTKYLEKFVEQYGNIINRYLDSFMNSLFANDTRSIQILRQLHKSENVTSSRKENNIIYNRLLKFNSSVDIHFGTSAFIDFLYEITGKIHLNNNVLVSIADFDVDNSFSDGEYMMFGNGSDHLNPLCTFDIISFVLGSCLFDGFIGSFEGLIGTCFEWWFYTNYNAYPECDIDNNGSRGFDWVIGEDI
jgi:hypothetical protein